MGLNYAIQDTLAQWSCIMGDSDETLCSLVRGIDNNGGLVIFHLRAPLPICGRGRTFSLTYSRCALAESDKNPASSNLVLSRSQFNITRSI